MIPEYFIARRITYENRDKQSIAKPIIRLAIFAIALSIAVMVITIAVVTAFKTEIRKKVIGFGSHIQIINHDSNISFETIPISENQDFLSVLESMPEIKKIQVYATKPGLIKTKTDNQGIIAKGIDENFDWTFFNENLVEGKSLNITDSVTTNDVLISKAIASLLRLKVGDEFGMYFINKKQRLRKFKISGIYETSLEEFDKQFILVDIKHIRKLNNWEDDQISGFEILINDYRNIDQIKRQIENFVAYRFLEDGSTLMVVSIKDKYPQIFDWLGLLDMNVIVILLVMAFVAIINMITGVIIIILDKTNMIGIIKALGATNKFVMNIFLYQSFILIIRGLVLGNFIALSLCYLQKTFQFLKLNQTSYFIDYVPVQLNLYHISLVNICSLFLIFIFMFLPVMVVININPIKTIRYN